MSSLAVDTRLSDIVAAAVANYGQYSGEVVGLGHGRVDQVLEMHVAPLDGLKHAYTREPLVNAHKMEEDTKLRCFVYVVPVEVRDGREQRMLVGQDGNELSIATFFRPVGLDAAAGDVYVAMPSQAFAGDGSEVQYAFRVRNFVQLSNDTLVPVDDLMIGMELTTSTQRKHPGRGVMLIKNSQMFSAQLGELGDKQRGFKMQYVAASSLGEMSAHSKGVLETQVFGFLKTPPTPEDVLASAIEKHFHLYVRRDTTPGGVTRSGATRCTRGGSRLSLANLLAGELRHWNVSASQAVPLAERARVELCMTVGDVTRVYHEKHVEAAVPLALAPVEAAFVLTDGFLECMRHLSRMLTNNRDSEQRKQMQQLSLDMCVWPVLAKPTENTALAVGVIQCDGKEDWDGVAMNMSSGNPGQRVYTVEAGTLIRVRVTNFSLCGASVELQPVYYSAPTVEPQSSVVLLAGETYELPFPLQKEPGEGVDGWLLRDGFGKTVLELLFVLSAQSLAAFREKQEREEREKKAREEREKKAREDREREEKESAMLVEGAPDAHVGEAMITECCVCFEKKLVRLFSTFIPCGHCVCCTDCWGKQVQMDAAAGKRSTCAKCRARVDSAMRVFF